MFNFVPESKIQTSCSPISSMTEEVMNYFEKTGVVAKVTDVLKLLYKMDEKPLDPLEYL